MSVLSLLEEGLPWDFSPSSSQQAPGESKLVFRAVFSLQSRGLFQLPCRPTDGENTRTLARSSSRREASFHPTANPEPRHKMPGGRSSHPPAVISSPSAVHSRSPSSEISERTLSPAASQTSCRTCGPKRPEVSLKSSLRAALDDVHSQNFLSTEALLA